MHTTSGSSDAALARLRRAWGRVGAGVVVLIGAACGDGLFGPVPGGEERLDPELVAAGKEVFRFDDFDNARFWTDTLRLHELVQGVDPATALSLGLKVDADAVPGT